MFGASKSGFSFAGSTEKTSKAAPARWPDSQRLGDRRLVDEAAAGAVDEPRARLHPRDALGGEDVRGLLGLRQVQGDEVGAGEQVVEVLDALDAEGDGALGGEEGVVGDDLHLQPDGARGDHRADVAAADEAEGLAGDLDAHEARLLPPAGAGRGVGGGDLPGAGEQHGDRVLGGGDRVAEGGVHHHDALGRGRGDVDVVDADAGAADDAQGAGLGDQVGGDLGRRADGEAVVAADDLGELRGVLAERRLEVDLDAAVAEDLHGGVGELVGNEYLGHEDHPLSVMQVDSSGQGSGLSDGGSGAPPTRFIHAADKVPSR